MKPLWRLLAGAVGNPAIRLLARTWRVEVAGEGSWQAAQSTGKPFVLLCWHETLLPVLWHHRHRGIAAVVSQARDGEYLARLARGLGYRLIRGSSSRGRTRALRGAIRMLQAGIPVGLTPDGPRGPRRVLKPGAIAAAQLSGAVVVPVSVRAGSAWRARSWDRFLVPRPFARVRLAYGRPFTVPPGPGGRSRGEWVAIQALTEAEQLAAWPGVAETPTG